MIRDIKTSEVPRQNNFFFDRHNLLWLEIYYYYLWALETDIKFRYIKLYNSSKNLLYNILILDCYENIKKFNMFTI